MSYNLKTERINDKSACRANQLSYILVYRTNCFGPENRNLPDD